MRKYSIALFFVVFSFTAFSEPALQYAGSGIWSGFEALNAPGGQLPLCRFSLRTRRLRCQRLAELPPSRMGIHRRYKSTI